MFWGKWPLNLTVWVLAVLGAFVITLPRIFPPILKGKTGLLGLQISNEFAPGVIAAGAIAVLLGAGLKEVDAHVAKQGAASALGRAANAVSDLHKQLPRMLNGEKKSKDRRERVIEAAQNCALRLLQDSGNNIRVTFYQLEYDELEQAPNTKPGDRPIEQARLILVGDPLGRGEDPARREFIYDSRGRATLQRILAKQEIWCANAKKQARKAGWPTPKYEAYISVPIIVAGQVEGMLSCDSLVKKELKQSIAALLKIPANFAGVELRTLESSSTPIKPNVRE